MKTIKIPTTEGVKEVTGQVCIFPIGEKKHKFFIHDCLSGNDQCLVDYASGMIVGKLRAIKISYHRSYQSLTDRAAAEILLQKVIEKYGPERTLQTINQAERIN